MSTGGIGQEGSTSNIDSFRVNMSGKEKVQYPFQDINIFQKIRNYLSPILQLIGMAPKNIESVSFQEAKEGKVDRRCYLQNLKSQYPNNQSAEFAQLNGKIDSILKKRFITGDALALLRDPNYNVEISQNPTNSTGNPEWMQDTQVWEEQGKTEEVRPIICKKTGIDLAPSVDKLNGKLSELHSLKGDSMEKKKELYNEINRLFFEIEMMQIKEDASNRFEELKGVIENPKLSSEEIETRLQTKKIELEDELGIENEATF